MLPNSKLGKWSAGLALMVFLVVLIMGIASDFEGFSSDTNNALIILFQLAVVFPTIASLVTGIVSIIKYKERSVVVFLGLAIVLWFGIPVALHMFNLFE